MMFVSKYRQPHTCQVLQRVVLLILLGVGIILWWAAPSLQAEMTEERALALGEEFGVDVGEVDEESQKFLGLTRAEGVVVFEVIGGTPADLAGVKPRAIIKEVDGNEITTLLDLGRALEMAMPRQNFSVATYEPSGVDDQGIGGGLNFHFVRVLKD